jgi:hypothetical protein
MRLWLEDTLGGIDRPANEINPIMTLVVGTVEVSWFLPVFMRRNWAPVSLQLAEADTTQSAVAIK